MLEESKHSNGRWYVSHRTNGLTPEERISRTTGLTYKQIRRLKIFATGDVVTRHDLGLEENAMKQFLVRLRKKLPMLDIRNNQKGGYYVAGKDLMNIRELLGVE